MNHAIFIFVGAGLGALLRWYTQSQWGGLGASMPWGTFIVNAGGGLAAGMLLTRAPSFPTWVMPALMTGFLGGLTTFSAFTAESLVMMQQGEFLKSMAYVVGSVIVALGACYAGTLL